MSIKNGKIVKCENCGIEVYKPLNKLLRAKNYFCSPGCFDKFRQDKVEVDCDVCGKKMLRVRSRVDKKYITCSKECLKIRLKGVNLSGFFKKGNKGEKCINFKDGTQMTNGYISVLMPEHPYATKKGYVYQHRLVMEKRIGRYLNPEEVVHHKNEIKTDNEDENLMLFPTDKEHHRHHMLLRHGKIDIDGNEIKEDTSKVVFRQLETTRKGKGGPETKLKFEGHCWSCGTIRFHRYDSEDFGVHNFRCIHRGCGHITTLKKENVKWIIKK